MCIRRSGSREATLVYTGISHIPLTRVQVRALGPPFDAYADAFESNDVSGAVILDATDSEIMKVMEDMSMTTAHGIKLRTEFKRWSAADGAAVAAGIHVAISKGDAALVWRILAADPGRVHDITA